MIRRGSLAAVVGVAFLGGCGPSTRNEASTIVRDTLPGGVVRVRGPEGGSWTDGGNWSLLEEYRLGVVEVDGPELFGEVFAVEMDAAGRLYVLDRMAKEVRVFDTGGSFVRAMGRDGEGPGEFREPFGLTWDTRGHLWIVDVRLRRYSVFDADGQHLREYRRRAGGYSWPWPGRFARDGHLYEASYVGGGNVVVRFNPEAELAPVDSFPLALPEPSRFWDLRDERRLGAVVAIPFAGQVEWVLDHEARLWVGDGAIYALTHRCLSGDTLLVVERAVSPVAVSSEERQKAIRELDEYAGHPRLDLSLIPATKPFFRRLIADSDGNLWVLREGSEHDWFFDVFGSDGVFLGSIILPVTPSLYPPPLVRSGRMVVVATDDLGTQSVVVYRIQRGAG